MIMLAICLLHTLIHTISFGPQPTMKVNIHNQCSDFKLVNRGHFSRGADWNRCPDEEVDTDNIISNDFRPFLARFEGALIYELQRKHVNPDHRPMSADIRFFVAWESEGYKEFRVLIHLMVCDKTSHWDEIKPEVYYQRYAGRLSTYTCPIKDTWLTDHGIVLMTESELDFMQRDGRLNITISEGTRDVHTRRPVWIDLKR
jgi:hypothetical protein